MHAQLLVGMQSSHRHQHACVLTSDAGGTAGECVRSLAAIMWMQWLDAHMTMTSDSHVSAHSTCLTFWRWRCSCWLRAFLVRASASFCALASGTAALMLRLANACLAAGTDLALASEPPLNAGEWTSRVPVSCSADCTSMTLGHPVRRYAMGWPLKTECLLMGFAQTLRAHAL